MVDPNLLSYIDLVNNLIFSLRLDKYPLLLTSTSQFKLVSAIKEEHLPLGSRSSFDLHKHPPATANMAMDAKTAAEIADLTVIERVCSVFSILGCFLIIFTFAFSKYFHKPINRLVFYASFGNLMTNVATLMSTSFTQDSLGAGCQFQAFLIQMFMPADALWTLAMAINVYLTFYYKFDAQKLRKMELPYFVVCYGIPFVVAITYIFINHPERGRMYGDARLWCWISKGWSVWRIATFYGPIWVVILVTFFIYVRAGAEIYAKHKQLRDFSSHHEPEPLPPMDDPFSASKTTEVCVTSETVPQPGIDLAVLGRRGSEAGPANASPKPPGAAYSITISASKRHENRESLGEIDLPIQTNTSSNPTISAISAGNSKPANQRQRRRAAYEANSAAWSYTKCAILFFTALLVTWIPSSANRVYGVIHTEADYPLEYMSAFVLPLQGFWNAIIYVVTSWKACRMLWDDIFHSNPKPSRKASGSDGHHHRSVGATVSDGFHMMGRSKSEKSYETESMTELASRSGSTERVVMGTAR